MNTSQDLGFSLQQDNLNGINLFEAFAAGKADLNQPADTSATSTDTTSQQNQQQNQATSSQPPVTPDATPENQNALSAMMNEFFTNGAKPSTTDTPGAAASTTPADNGAAAQSTDNTPKSQIQVVYDFFKEKKILKEVDGFDGSEQMMETALTETINERLPQALEQHIEQTFATRPQQAGLARQLFDHLAKGGTVADFVTLNSDTAIDPAAFQSPDKSIASAAAEQSIVSYYTELGWKSEAIQKQIKTLKALGDDMLIETGQTTYDQWTELKKQQRDQHAATLQQNMTLQQQQMQERNQKLVDLIETGGEFLGVKLDTPDKKQKAKDFIFKPSIPDPKNPGKKITPYVAELRKRSSTPEYLVTQAIMLMEGEQAVKAALTTQGKTQTLSDLEKRLSDINNPQNRAVTQGSSGTPAKDAGKTEPKPDAAYFDIDVLPLK
jgi:hypothetical protein